MKEELNWYKENKIKVDKAFKSLKKVNKRKLDEQFHSAHDEVFENLDCLSCANCCKTTSPIFREVDIKRFAKGIRMKETDFINQYLMLDEEGDYVLKSAPCPFLNLDNNECFHYELRPQACKEYPHTNRKNMYQILNLTKRNLEVCPAVVKITQQILPN